MSNYSQDKFSDDGSVDSGVEQSFKLKLSVDVLSVKNLQMSANLQTKLNLNLQASGLKNNTSLINHSFAAKEATPVNQGAHETKLADSFASYEFVATKSELGAILTNCEVDVSLVHSINQKTVGRVGLPLRFLESGE